MLNNEFMEVTVTKHDIFKNLFSSLTYNQIWFIPVLDDHQST
jgi:hypothetical protein